MRRMALGRVCTLAVAVFIGLAGCVPRQPEPAAPARPPIATSYPSPDYLPGQPTESARPAAPAPVITLPAPTSKSPAQAAAPGAGLPFDAIDTDHNGRITLEEWRNFQEKEFRRLDTNDDGVLTREEVYGKAPARKARPTP